MGTDIHLVAEQHYSHWPPGQWAPVYHQEITFWRNYKLFARLANVRNHDDQIEPIAMPRGLPMDASEWTQKWAEENRDYHSFSWISKTEMTIYFAREDSEFGHFCAWMLTSAGKWGDIRLIFAFDC